jgi:hypothetical protein
LPSIVTPLFLSNVPSVPSNKATAEFVVVAGPDTLLFKLATALDKPLTVSASAKVVYAILLPFANNIFVEPSVINFFAIIESVAVNFPSTNVSFKLAILFLLPSIIIFH